MTEGQKIGRKMGRDLGKKFGGAIVEGLKDEYRKGYQRANADTLKWMEEHPIDILDGAGDRGEVICAYRKYIEKDTK